MNGYRNEKQYEWTSEISLLVKRNHIPQNDQ